MQWEDISLAKVEGDVKAPVIGDRGARRHISPNMPLPVDATTRDVKVDALVPWSATVIRYRSNARATFLQYRGRSNVVNPAEFSFPTSPGNLPRDLNIDKYNQYIMS